MCTTSFTVFEVQIGSYSIRDEKMRKKSFDKLNKVFNRVNILPFSTAPFNLTGMVLPQVSTDHVLPVMFKYIFY